MRFFLFVLFFINFLNAENNKTNFNPGTINLSNEEKQYLIDNPILKIGYTTAFSPLLFIDDNKKVRGIIPDIYDLLSKKHNLKFEYVIDSWAQTHKNLQDNNIDIIPAMAKSLAIQKGFLTSSPISRTHLEIYTNNKDIKIDSFNDLKGIKLTYNKNIRFLDKQLKSQYQDKIDLVPASSTMEGIIKVKNRQADAIIMWNRDKYLLEKNQIYDMKSIYYVNEISFESSSATNNKILNSILIKLMNSVSIDESKKIQEKYLGKIQNTNQSKLTNEEKSYLKKNVFNIYLNNWEPYINIEKDENGTMLFSGIGIEYFRRITKDIPIKYRLIDSKSFPALLNDLKNDPKGVTLTTSKSADKESYALFSKSYTSYPVGLLTKNSESFVESLGELKGKTVAVGEKFTAHRTLKENYPNIKLRLVKNTLEAIDLVLRDEVYAAADLTASLIHLKKEFGYSNLKISAVTEEKLFLRMLTNKSSYQLNKILDKLIKSNPLYKSNYERKSLDLPIKEKQYLNKKNEFILCNQYDLFPITDYYNGKLKGIMGDIYELIEKKLNIKFKALDVSSNLDLKTKVEKNQCDLVSIVLKDQKDLKNIISTNSLFDSYFNSIGNLESNYFHEKTDLSKKLFYVKSKEYRMIFNKFYPEINIAYEPNINIIMEKIFKDKNSYYLDNQYIAERLILDFGYDKYKINGSFKRYKLAMSIGVNETQKELVSILNKAISNIGQEEIDRIIGNHSIKEFKIDNSYQYLWYVLVFFIILFLILQLRHLKQKREQEKEKKKLLENLEESRKIAKIGSFVYDFSKKHYVEFDESLYDIFEIDKKRYPIVDREIFFNFIHPEDKKDFKESLSSSFSKKGNNQADFRILTKNGIVKYIHANWKILHDEDKNPIKSVATLQDNTQTVLQSMNEKRLRQEIEKEKERFMLATEATELGIFDWNVKVGTIFYSEQWKKMLGYEYYEIENSFESWEELTHKDDLKKTREAVERYLTRLESSYDADFRMKHKDGHWIWINARGKATFDDNNQAIRMIGFHTDITKRVEEEENKIKQLNLIQKQSRLALQGEMLNMIAHQWRQPLNHLTIMNQIFIRKIKNEVKDIEVLDEFKKDSVTLIDHMSQTISDFSNFYRPDKSVQSVSVFDFLENAMKLVLSKIKYIDLKINYNGFENYKIVTLKNELIQVFLTIINNSIEAMDNDFKNKYIKIDCQKKEDFIKFIIEDNAGGIKPDIIKNVFDPYFSTKENKNGTGLGLYMTKIIIEESIGGKVELESKDDTTTFFIYIPTENEEKI